MNLKLLKEEFDRFLKDFGGPTTEVSSYEILEVLRNKNRFQELKEYGLSLEDLQKIKSVDIGADDDLLKLVNTEYNGTVNAEEKLKIENFLDDNIEDFRQIHDEDSSSREYDTLKNNIESGR